MTTQSVKVQSDNLFAGSSAKPNSAGKSSQSSGFDLLFNTSRKSSEDVNDISSIQLAKTANTKKSNQTSDGKKKDDNNTKPIGFSVGKNEADTSLKDNKVSDSQSVTGKDQEEDLKDDNQVISQITGMLQAVQEAAMKALNLSQEELKQLLTSQGMTAADLLQPEKLQQLILAANGANDILSAITDESLAATMKQLMNAVDQIKDNANLGLTADQIKALLEQAKEVKNAQPDIVVNQQDVLDQANLQEEQAGSAQKPQIDGEADKATTDITSSTELNKAASDGQQKLQNQGSFNGNHPSDHRSKDDTASKDHFQIFVDNLVKSSQNVQNGFADNVNQIAQFREIVNQIVERIKVSVTPNSTSMELQLNPENLGRVNLNLQSKNGVMTAQFIVQNEVTKQAIESQMQTLRDTLNQQGVKIEAIEVTVSANAFEQNYNQESGNQEKSQKNNSGKKITLDEALNMSEVMEEVVQADTSGLTGTQINYTA